MPYALYLLRYPQAPQYVIFSFTIVSLVSNTADAPVPSKSLESVLVSSFRRILQKRMMHGEEETHCWLELLHAMGGSDRDEEREGGHDFGKVL